MSPSLLTSAGRTGKIRGMAPHPILASDVKALIGILAVLEGEAMVDGIDPALAMRLRERLVRADLVPSGSHPSQMPQALGDLNQRLRHALGEYDLPPQ